MHHNSPIPWSTFAQYLTVTDEHTKEGACFLSMGWGHGTIIESREQALGVAKALIDHYNIKQEELYPELLRI